MIIEGKTDKGSVRKTNQDDFAIGELVGGASFVVVCDGMGGANGGSVASSTAVAVISDTIIKGFSPSLDKNGIKYLLKTSISSANTAVFELAGKDTSLFGMGTTVVACIVGDGIAIVAHAGDSRAYLVSDGIRQLTKDHSVVQDMIENGKITLEEALVHPQKNIITRALGVEESLEIDFCESDFVEGDSIIICTDGLTNLVDDKEIEVIAKELPPQECAERLVNMAIKYGGFDNITVVVICNALTGSEING